MKLSDSIEINPLTGLWDLWDFYGTFFESPTRHNTL